MKYLVKNKIPDLTPYVSLNYNGDVSYAQISGSGLPSTIHAEEDGLYIEKNNKIWPMTHPDLSTLLSILPLRFGKLPIYEELIPFLENICTKKEKYTEKEVLSEVHDYTVVPENMTIKSYTSYTIELDSNGYYFYNSEHSKCYLNPSACLIIIEKDQIFLIFNNQTLSNMNLTDDYYYDNIYIVYVYNYQSSDMVPTYILKNLIPSSDTSSYSIKKLTDFLNSRVDLAALLANRTFSGTFCELTIYDLIKIKLNIINRTNIIQASAFNETNYSPITIENGIITTELNFKPDYFLIQYFGEIMDNYYYINSNNSNGSKSLIGNFLMKDLTLKDINDVSDMSLVLGIYIGDNIVTGERLFVTAESLLNTKTYKFRVSASTLPGNFQSSDFYTSTTKVVGQENKIFAGRAPFATEGNINGVTVDWGGESNTEAWLYLINKYNLDLSDYPTLEYASTHNGYLMGAGEGSLFVTNYDAILKAYTKLTGNGNSFWSWESSFGLLYSAGSSYLASLYFSPGDTYSDSSYYLGSMGRVCLLITLSKKYTLYFSWSTYKWCKGSEENTMTKYCTNSSCGYNGFTDDKTELDLEDDAAYVNWSAAWRMPSEEQFRELINSSYTTTEWTTQNGVNGRKITSKTNGNSIFLPAAGYHYGSSLSNGDSYGNLYGGYWSRTLDSDSPNYARYLGFYSNTIYVSYYSRYYGQSVRPVCTDSSQANHEYVDLGLPSGTLWATTNIGATTPEEYGLYFAWGETEGYQ